MATTVVSGPGPAPLALHTQPAALPAPPTGPRVPARRPWVALAVDVPAASPRTSFLLPMPAWLLLPCPHKECMITSCPEGALVSVCRRMPPKSKEKGRKGVKQQQKRNIAESQAEEKYRKAALEVDMPKEHLVPWRDMAQQAKADNEVLKWRLWDLDQALEQTQEDKKDIHKEMTWQYQELQKQTAAHSQRLEAKVKSVQEQLATRLQESQQTQETATQAVAERDRTIAQLQGRLDAMEREYEKILHMSGDVAVGGSPGSTVLPPHGPLSHRDSPDLVLAKMAEASQHWEEVGRTIAVEHKECLQEFGLNPLEL